MKIDLKLNGAELPYADLSFYYFEVEFGVKQQTLCLIPGKRIKKFINVAMRVCRNTEQLSVVVRIK